MLRHSGACDNPLSHGSDSDDPDRPFRDISGDINGDIPGDDAELEACFAELEAAMPPHAESPVAIAGSQARGARAQAAPDEPLPSYDFGDITALLDGNEFVEGLYPHGAMSVLYGDPGTGKTFFAMDLGLHVAGGIPWRDRRVEQGGVVYIACEGQRGIRNRIAAFKKDRGCDPGRFKFAIVPASVDLRDPAADTPRVIATVKAKAEQMGVPVVMVIVDTLSRAMAGGDENSPGDMGALVGNVGRIQEATGAHVQLIHHCGKDAARGARGHSSLKGAVETEIEVTRSESSGVSVVKVAKQKDGESGGRFAFALRPVELGLDKYGKPVTSCVVDPADAPTQEAKLSGQERKALTALQVLIKSSGREGDEGVPEGVKSVPVGWWRDRYCGTDLPKEKKDSEERTFRRVRDALVAKGRVGCVGERTAARAWLTAAGGAATRVSEEDCANSSGGPDRPDTTGQSEICPVRPISEGTGQTGQNPSGLSGLSGPSSNGSRKGEKKGQKKGKGSAVEKAVAS